MFLMDPKRRGGESRSEGGRMGGREKDIFAGLSFNTLDILLQYFLACLFLMEICCYFSSSGCLQDFSLPSSLSLSLVSITNSGRLSAILSSNISFSLFSLSSASGVPIANVFENWVLSIVLYFHDL